jgi:hypothetical protein
MQAHGFVNYPTEWWHFSYGDRYWAYHQAVDVSKINTIHSENGIKPFGISAISVSRSLLCFIPANAHNFA